MNSFSSKFRNFLCDWQNFCRKNWKCFCHNDIVTSFIYCYWRANVETRVFVEAIFGIWRFFEIFANFQRFSRFHLRVKVWAQIIFQNVKVIDCFQKFCNQYKQTAWVQTAWFLTKRLCQIESSSQRNQIIIIFQV